MNRIRRGVLIFCVLGSLGIAAPALAGAASTVTGVTARSLEHVISANRGKVVLVNFWATYCPTCIDEFPVLLRAQKQYKSRGLVVLFVSGDLPEDLNSKVRPYLQGKHAHDSLYIITQDQDSFVPNFDKSWDGGLPRTYIFDRKGHFRYVTSEEQTDASVSRLLRPYL